MQRFRRTTIAAALAVMLATIASTPAFAETDAEKIKRAQAKLALKFGDRDKIDLKGQEWPEDDGTRLRKMEAHDVARMQICRLRPGLRKKRYATRPLTHDEDTKEIKALLALIKRAPPAKPIPRGVPLERAPHDRSLVVQPVDGKPFEILYASGFHVPFGRFHSVALKEALFALGGGRTRISVIHLHDGKVRRVIHHKAIAPHTGGYYSQTISAEMHLISEKGLTLYVKVRDGKTVLMEDEKPMHYGDAKIFTSKVPGTYVVLLHRP